MGERIHPRLTKAVHATPLAASAIVGACGLLVCFGWLANIEFLKSLLHPQRVAMNPATAMCFIFAAVALFLLRREPIPPAAKLAAQTLALVIALVGLARILAYAAGWEFRVDQFMFQSKIGSNVMAPNTAVAFILLGVGLSILDVRVGKHRLHPSQV